MANRILKETVCTSPNIEMLDWFEEVCFYRLIVQCDDYGRLDARPVLLRAKLFPLREDINTAEVECAMAHLEEAGLIERYVVEGRDYLRLPSWTRHQKVRSPRAKFPPPLAETTYDEWSEDNLT